MTLTSTTSTYSVTYTRKSIPEEVKTHYMPVTKDEATALPIL